MLNRSQIIAVQSLNIRIRLNSAATCLFDMCFTICVSLSPFLIVARLYLFIYFRYSRFSQFPCRLKFSKINKNSPLVSREVNILNELTEVLKSTNHICIYMNYFSFDVLRSLKSFLCKFLERQKKVPKGHLISRSSG